MSQPSTNNKSPANDSRPLVFAVDDEPMLLELVALVLEPLGFRVRTFRDPDTAMRAFGLTTPPPALIVTDYAMHTMNGMDLIQACRRIHPRQKVILVSGTVDETIYRNAECKPDRFLAKPYQAKQLADLVRAILAE
ncbi:MAG: response regulator [Verrucomicrobia bacterium]|jgi:DNA-binding NtrC family response regulator|nr:response regulator [Verrucomicrobiota bacterium]